MAWQKGPLPPGTWNWGGVIPVGDVSRWGGFYFADFHGDHVTMNPGNKGFERVLKADDVAWFCNCLDLPPGGFTGRADLAAQEGG